MLVGGLLLYKFKWNCKQMLKVATILEFVALLTVFCTLIGCDGREVVGGNVPYGNGLVFFYCWNIRFIIKTSLCLKKTRRLRRMGMDLIVGSLLRYNSKICIKIFLFCYSDLPSVWMQNATWIVNVQLDITNQFALLSINKLITRLVTLVAQTKTVFWKMEQRYVLKPVL